MDTRTAIREYTEDSQLRAILEVLPDSADETLADVTPTEYWDDNDRHERDWKYVTDSIKYVVQSAICEDNEGIKFHKGDRNCGVVICTFRFDDADCEIVFTRDSRTGTRISLSVSYEIDFSMFHKPARSNAVMDVVTTDGLGEAIEDLVEKVHATALKKAAESYSSIKE